MMMLLRLAYRPLQSEETRKDPAPPTAAKAGSVSSPAPSSGANVDAGDLPPTEPNPLVIAGIEIPLFWRNKRIVAVEEDRVTEELRSALDARALGFLFSPHYLTVKNRSSTT